MKILVTAACGNVGSAIIREIEGPGHDVVYFDQPSRANRAKAKRAGVKTVFGGTRNVIAACTAMATPPRIAFASSVALFSPTQHLPAVPYMFDETIGRTFLIGGGPRCQLRQREIVQKPLVALGIGELPEEAFGTTPFSIDWVDSTESERVLRYQGYDFDDCVRDMVRLVGWRRPFIRLAKPIARRKVLSASAYYKAARAESNSSR